MKRDMMAARRAGWATMTLTMALLLLLATWAPPAAQAGVSEWRDGNIRGATWDDGLLLVQPSLQGWCTGNGVDGLVHDVGAPSGRTISNGATTGPQPVAIYDAPGDSPESVVNAFRAEWCPVIAAGGVGPTPRMTGEATTRSIITSTEDQLSINIHSWGWVIEADGTTHDLFSHLKLTVTFTDDGPPFEDAKISDIRLG